MNETIIRKIPTPALVFVIAAIDSNNEDAFPTSSETSSVKPLLIILAECADISENSLFGILKVRVNNPTKNEIIARTSTAPPSVITKLLAVNANIVTSGINIFRRYVARYMPSGLFA